MTAWDGAGLLELQAVGALQKRLLVLFVIASAFDGFDLQSIGFLAPYIGKALGIGAAQFGAVFSLGLVGLCMGTIAVPGIADRVGRRPCLIAVLAYIGAASIATAFVSTREGLILCRFLTSIGLGGALPLIGALTAEYMPTRHKALSVCLLCAAIPAGGLCAALLGGVILPLWGWPSVFIAGGIAPLAIAILLYFCLPNSVQALGPRRQVRHDVLAWAARLWPGARIAIPAQSVCVVPPQAASYRSLFANSAWRVSMPLAAAFFMSLLVLYFLVNWIPVLLNQAAFPPSVGILAISMFSLGGIVGALAQGPLMRWFGPVKSIMIELAIVGGLVVSLGKIPLTASVISALTFAIGWTLQGAQAGLNAFTAMHYQNSIRATAMGLTLGTGRLGSIAGGFLGGLALAAGWLPRSILAAAAIPSLICALAFACAAAGKRFIERHDASPLEQR